MILESVPRRPLGCPATAAPTVPARAASERGTDAPASGLEARARDRRELHRVRRSQAQKLASDLVAQGQLARDQLGAAVDELSRPAADRSEELRTVVRAEVQRQLGVLGLATQA